MITEVRLLNYKKFLNEQIPLKPITVFIGPNGSGKSTIGSAIYSIATILRLGLNAALPEGFYSFNSLINHDAEDLGYRFSPIGLGISGNVGEISFDYDIIFGRDLNSLTGFFINFEGIRIQSNNEIYHFKKGKDPKLSFTLPTSGKYDWIEGLTIKPQRDCLFIEIEKLTDSSNFKTYLKAIKTYIQKITKYQFSASESRLGSDQYDGSGRQPFLKNDGSNLSEVVQYLQEEQRGLLARMKDWVVKYAEGGSKIVDIGVATYEEKVFLNFYEEGKRRKSFAVRGPLLSDGYWVFASFACLASCELLPSVAFFEEPECHLHPHKLPILFNIFESMATREDNPCQILISTHSPYFLDQFKNCPDSVIFLNNGEAKRLSEIDNYDKILSLSTLGDAWFSNVFSWGNP